MLKFGMMPGRAIALAAMFACSQAVAQSNDLVGEIGGPTVVTDMAAYPTKLAEAPMLAGLVEGGTLPPLADRLPVREDLLVLQPLDAVGKHGGTLRSAFTGPGDAENGNRINASDKLMFSDPTGTEMRPSIAKAFAVNADATRYTLTLRRGLRWSDGDPFDADDIVWWFENVWSNKEINPAITSELSVNGKPGRIEKVDGYTVAYVFAQPYPLFEEIIRGDNYVGGGASRYAANRNGMGGYAASHYLKTFHAAFASEAELKAEMLKDGHQSWVELYLAKANWTLNAELPVLAPWKTVSPINAASWVLERNPYFHAVDTAGNQLPYIDRIEMTLAENLEVLNLRAAAGELDFQSRHLDISKLPVFLENRQKGNYSVNLNPSLISAASLFFNLAWRGDRELETWYNTADFRRALSMAINREQINEVFFLGLGVPGSSVIAEEHPHNPGAQWRKTWSEFDPARAGKMLDDLGLTAKDADGFRLRKDGKGRLRLEILTWSAHLQDFTGMAEMVARDWAAVGIHAELVEVERTLGQTRLRANENQLELTEASSTDALWSSPGNIIPASLLSPLGIPIATWYTSNGKEGLQPDDPELLRGLNLLRSAPALPRVERDKVAQEIWRIHVDQQWTIGLVGQAPGAYGVRIASNRLGNVPERLSQVREARVPGGAWLPTFYFKD